MITPSSHRTKLILAALIIIGLLGAAPAQAQFSPNMKDMMKRIAAGEFGGGRGGPGAGGRWVDGGQGYVVTERTPDGGSEIVRYETATGKRAVLMTAAQLTPPQVGKPLPFGEPASTADGKVMLFSTNPRPTMIRKTMNDYWVLDKSDSSWHKLGGNSGAGLLYAKLSPDGTRAAYVRDNNIYVEDVRSGAVTALTSDGSAMIINGTSDWVY